MTKKYELTNEKKDFYGTTMFRIKALIDFGIVKKGELGGFIEKESNLSQEGDAWVYGDARVYGNAWVSGNARVYGNAQVYGKLKIKTDFYFGFVFKGQKKHETKLKDGNTLIWKSG